MKNKCIFTKTFLPSLIIFLISLQLIGCSDSGKISGKVIDQISQEPIENVLVRIKGTSIEITTDIDGIYTFSDVAPGNQVLIFQKDSYKPFELPIVVGKGSAIEAESIKLMPQSPEATLLLFFRELNKGNYNLKEFFSAGYLDEYDKGYLRKAFSQGMLGNIKQVVFSSQSTSNTERRGYVTIITDKGIKMSCGEYYLVSSNGDWKIYYTGMRFPSYLKNGCYK